MALLPPDEARARIIAGIVPTEPEFIPLDAAAGRVLAAPLAARRTQPPFPASAMDGYAVRSADALSGARLRIIGTAVAGKGFAGEVGDGEAVRIFTGAPVPAGADAILIQEDAEVDGETVLVGEAPAPGHYVRPAGLDFRADDVLLQDGQRLSARHIALAAAMNHSRLPVRRRPLVAVLATGDELVPPGDSPGPDQIVAASSAALLAVATDAGAVGVDLGIARDDAAEIAAAIDSAMALPADILVTIGGASVGEHDLVRQTLLGRGMDLGIWRVALRPGKPLISGRLQATRVLGLAGNPVSTLVCAELFLRPLIGALLGMPVEDPVEPAILGSDLPGNDGRQDYLRATLQASADGPPVATPFTVQDSSMLATLAAADCLLIRPPNAPAARAGESCRIIRLR